MKRAAIFLAAWVVASGVYAAVDFSALASNEQALLAPAKNLWLQLDAPAQQELRANAREWMSRSPADREALRARLREWDNLPVAVRAERRSAFAAWRRLNEAERAQLRRLATEYAALAPDQQQLLQTRFEQLAFDAQRNWQLGPTLGAQMASLAPMFAFVPESERASVFTLLRQLDASARADLVLLAPRLDNAGRERLRRQLQAAAPEARGELIRRQMD